MNALLLCALLGIRPKTVGCPDLLEQQAAVNSRTATARQGMFLLALVLVVGTANVVNGQANPPEPDRAAASSEQTSDDATADEGIRSLVVLLGQIDDHAFQCDLLKGIEEGLKGRRQVPMPEGWAALYRDKLCHCQHEEVRQRARRLSLVFGDDQAAAELRTLLLDENATLDERRAALAALHEARVPGLVDVLLPILNQPALRADILKALAAFDNPAVAQTILRLYQEFSAEERRFALDALTARLDSAHLLLKEVVAKNIATSDLSAEAIRKMRLLKDEKLNELIDTHWGKSRATPAEVEQQIAVLRSELQRIDARKSNRFHGRAVFARTCQQCHLLFGTGGKVGPDITGSHRANLDYLLANVVDPNAMIGKDYQAWSFFTEDGQVHVGLLVAENESAVTVRTATETITIPKDEIEEREQSELSMMPVGLLDRMSPIERQNLVTYLAANVQCAMLLTAENMADLAKGPFLPRWHTAGETWTTDASTDQITGVFESHTQSRSVTSDIYVFEGEIRFNASHSLKKGSWSVVLASADQSAGRSEDRWGVTFTSQNLIHADTGSDESIPTHSEKIGETVTGQLSTYRVVADEQLLLIYQNDTLLVRKERPVDMRGGTLTIFVSEDAEGSIDFELSGLSAPAESDLISRWVRFVSPDGP